MQHRAAIELLARTPMFSGLGGELLTAIYQTGDMLEFGVGQSLTSAGAPADAGLFILDGKATLIESEGHELA